MRLMIGSLLFATMVACTGSGDDPSTMGDVPSGDVPADEPADEQPRRATSRDFNGDGFDDMIVGAGNGSAQAMAFVKFGNAQGTGGPVLSLLDDQPRARFGFSVAVAGDLNKDGFADLVVGSPSFSGAQGGAYVYLGGPNFDATPDVRLQRSALVETFGRSVAGAGDMNGDGYDDVVVGSFADQQTRGKAWVYFGGAGGTFDPVADLELLVSSPQNALHVVDVAGAGDVNADGFDDLLISVSQNDGKGRAFLYLGGAKPSSEPYAVILDSTNTEKFGRSIAGLGDINGDTYDDFVIGAPNGMGRALFFLGGAGKTFTSPDVVVNGTVPNQNLGWAVSGAGDLNGDGLADAMITSPSYPSMGRFVGEVFVMYGDRNFTGANAVSLTNTARYFGWTANSVGDFNGDGASDVIFSAAQASLAGKAIVYFGAVGRAIDSIPDLHFDSPVFNAVNVR